MRPKTGTDLRVLCAAPVSGGHVAGRAKEQRAVQRLQRGQQGRDLGQKGIGENRRHFLVANAAGVTDQLAHIHAQCIGQPLKRAEGGYSLAILDLLDISAGYLHASGQLALAEVPGAADLLHLGCHLQTGFG